MRSSQRNRRTESSGATVGADSPRVSIVVAEVEFAAAVNLSRHRSHDRMPHIDDLLVEPVDFAFSVDDDVDRAAAHRIESRPVVANRTEHDAAVVTEREFGMLDERRIVLIAHDQSFGEPERDQQVDRRCGIGGRKAGKTVVVMTPGCSKTKRKSRTFLLLLPKSLLRQHEFDRSGDVFALLDFHLVRRRHIGHRSLATTA